MNRVIAKLTLIVIVAIAISVSFIVQDEMLSGMIYFGILFLGSVFFTLNRKVRFVKSENPIMKQEEITRLEDYVPLIEAKNLLNDGWYEDSLEIMIRELRSAHTTSKKIFSEFINELLEEISVIYSSHDVYSNFQKEMYLIKVLEYRQYMDELNDLIRVNNLKRDSRGIISSTSRKIPNKLLIRLQEISDALKRVDNEIQLMIDGLPNTVQ